MRATPAPPSPRRKALSHFGYGLVCVAALLAGSGLRWIQQSPLLVEAMLSPVTDRVRPKPFAGVSAITVLVLGCDQDLYYRGAKVLNKYARSDMMLVVKLDFANKAITGVSIPRDTVVAVPGYREQKINGYHVLGGADLSKQAVETLLPISIDRVIVLDFDAFQDMVDEVGGVEIDVPRRMKHTDRAAKLFIDLKPGLQVLDGYDAMCFVRYRSGDSDFKRIERQRAFMIAFKDAVARNPLKLPLVANHAKQMIGGAFSNRETVFVAKFAKEVGSENIRMGTIPVIDVPGSRAYELMVDPNQLYDTLVEYNLVAAPAAPTPSL